MLSSMAWLAVNGHGKPAKDTPPKTGYEISRGSHASFCSLTVPTMGRSISSMSSLTALAAFSTTPEPLISNLLPFLGTAGFAVMESILPCGEPQSFQVNWERALEKVKANSKVDRESFCNIFFRDLIYGGKQAGAKQNMLFLEGFFSLVI